MHLVLALGTGILILTTISAFLLLKTKAQAAQLLRERAFLFEVADNLPVGLFCKDLQKEGRIILWNKKAEESSGLSRDFVIGKTVHDLFPKEIADRCLENDKKALRQKGLTIPKENFILPNGKTVFVNTRLFPSSYQNGREASLLFGSAEDISLLMVKQEELHLAQEKLKERVFAKTAELSALAESIPQLVFATSAQGEGIYFNQRWTDYTGYKAGDPVTWEEVIHSEDVGAAKQAWEECLRTETLFEVEYRLKNREGKFHWFLVRALPIKDSTGKVTKWIGTCTDIDLHKETEKRLAQSEASFRQLADSMPQIVWTAHPDGEIDYYNAKWREFTANSPEVTQMRDWLSLIADEERDKVERTWEKSLKSGAPLQTECRLWDNKTAAYRWHLIRALPIRSKAGKVLRWFGTCTDIDQQKNAELEQNKFVSLIENSSDFIGICDLNQKVVYVNKAGLKMVGLAAYPETTVPQYFDKESYALISKSVIPTALKTGKWEGELHFYNSKTHETTPVWMNSFPIVDTVTGAPIGVATVSRNVADRKRAEEDRIQALGREQAALDASKMKSAFLATMSHEIRTPLNGIIGMAGLLMRTELDRRQLEFCSTIKSSSEVLLNIVNDILDLSKVEAGKLSLEKIDCDLLGLLDEVAASFKVSAVAKGLVFKTSFPQQPLRVRMDPTRFKQVLNNLLSNAIKFTEKGKVRFAVRVKETGANSLTISTTISDTGIGMDSNAKARLFQSFSQADSSTSRKYGGTGLGLAISKKIVELMQGEIHVNSALNKGTSFSFNIQADKSPVDFLETKRSEPLLLRRGRILIVEDNPVNQRLMEILLEELKQETVSVGNGKQAIDRLNEERFDLILMDCQMPEMDGFEATQIIRASRKKHLRDIPIIALTADAFKAHREKCFSVGMNGYLCKPFKRSDLIALLDRWLPGNHTKKNRLPERLGPARKKDSGENRLSC